MTTRAASSPAVALGPVDVGAGTVEAVEEPPWDGHGPRPRVTRYPPGQQPALWVHTAGRWRYAPVIARQDTPDGWVYQVEIRLPDRGDGIEGTRVRLYRWPQPALRTAHGPA